MKLYVAFYGAIVLAMVSGLCTAALYNPDRIAGSSEDQLYMRALVLTSALLLVVTLLGVRLIIRARRERITGQWID